jgi:chromosome segregation ATPase
MDVEVGILKEQGKHIIALLAELNVSIKTLSERDEILFRRIENLSARLDTIEGQREEGKRYLKQFEEHEYAIRSLTAFAKWAVAFGTALGLAVINNTFHFILFTPH